MRKIVGLIIICLASATFSSGQTFTTLANFEGNNGSYPVASLVQATDGSFYGLTPFGGSENKGTAFKVTPDGILTTVYTFCVPQSCPDGDMPKGALIQANDGNFYGTTYYGGSTFAGIILRITPQGTLTTLYNFGNNLSDGAYPLAGLAQAKDGNFYGTTSGGGQSSSGTVFKMTPEGVVTVLHSFIYLSDGGYNPEAGLVQASDGNFYGTTADAGSGHGGTVFRITPSGALTTLYNFGVTDGSNPYAGLVQGKDGNLYGTTYYGGTYSAGTVFKITLQGALTTLYSFCSQENCPDGKGPAGSLIQATDGNFYGTASGGGQNNWGTIFRMTPDGTLTTLHDFNHDDGGVPYAALVQATDRSFYGTTYQGGSSDLGTVFRLVVYPALTVTKSGMGTVTSVDGHIYCGNTCSYRYFDGEQIALSAVPASGYTLGGWTGCDHVNETYCYMTMAGARNATAAFTSANVTLTSLTFKPSYVKGGQLSAGTLTLSGAAPPGGLGVALSSEHPGAAHPPSFVIVPGGKMSVQFAVQTLPVKSNTAALITATAGASHVSGTLTVGTTSLPSSLK